MMDIDNSRLVNRGGYLQKKSVNDFDYGLEDEKQRAIKIARRVKDELLAKWRKTYADAEIFPPKVAAMHPEVVNFLLSFNLVAVYDDIAKQSGLDEQKRNELPHIVWEIAETKKWDEIDQILQTKISSDQKTKDLIIKLLNQNVFDKIRALSEKPVEKKENAAVKETQKMELPLAKALEQYPKLGEQSLTVNALKLKHFPAPARPSIKNWITDFRDNMGGGKHGAIDRGNYLFHGENGKKLTPFERQKVSMVLKSLDENSPLVIDSEKQVVIFSAPGGSASGGENFGQIITSDQPLAENSRQTFQSREAKPPIEGLAFNGSVSAVNDQRDVFQRYVSKIPGTPKKRNFIVGSFGGNKIKSESEEMGLLNNFGSSTENKKTSLDHTQIQTPIIPKPKKIDAVADDSGDISKMSGNVSFSSAQKFASERNRQDSQWKIKPAGDFGGSNNIENEIMQASQGIKNVINLKE